MASLDNNIIKEIPKGFCQCGCGQKTTIPLKNHTASKSIKGEPKRFILGHHSRVNPIMRENHYNWKGGRTKDGKVLMPIHPRSSRDYVFEYILIAEKALGKYLPDKAVVHHHTTAEIIVCQNQAYHLFIHARTRAYFACGHADWFKCVYCKQYDKPENIVTEHKTTKHYHAQCYIEYKKQRRKIKMLRNH